MNGIKQVVVLGALCMGVGSAWAVYKCVDASGRAIYQDSPCAQGQQQKELTEAPAAQGVNPTQGSRPVSQMGRSGPAPAPAAAPPTRPADCPSPEEMNQLQQAADSVALKLPIREQRRKDFEALKQRCDGP